MSKVLLLGGAGYVGVPVAEYLVEKGYQVVVIDNFTYEHQPAFLGMLGRPNVEFFNYDLTSDSGRRAVLDIFSECEFSVILAGLVGDPITKKYPEKSREINSVALKILIEEMSGFPDKRVIFVSTCSNYGLMPEGVLATEESDLSPLSLYAEAKVENEEFFLSLAKEKDLTHTVLRFATAFGLAPRMRFDLTVNQFTRSLAVGDELVVFDADTWRPYCHVKDFARLIGIVFESDSESVKGQVFNAGGDENNYTKRKLVELIVSKLPSANVSYQENGGDPRNYKVSFEKVKQVLGFVPSCSVEFGVDEVLTYVQKGFFRGDVNTNLYGNYDL